MLSALGSRLLWRTAAPGHLAGCLVSFSASAPVQQGHVCQLQLVETYRSCSQAGALNRFLASTPLVPDPRTNTTQQISSQSPIKVGVRYFSDVETSKLDESSKVTATSAASISPLQAAIPTSIVQTAPAVTTSSSKEATCHYRNVQGSIKKFNLILKVVRRLQVDDAIAQCDLAKKRSSVAVKQALINALSNAVHQKGMDREKTIVDEIYVTKGQYQKRMLIMGRGFVGIKQKRFCHLKVVLREAPEKIRHKTLFMEPIMSRPLKHRATAAADLI